MLAAAIAELHDAELDLAGDLDAAAHKHALDADMLHHCTVLAGFARHRAAALRVHGEPYPASVGKESPGLLASAVDAVRELSAHVVGRREASAAVLLADLRDLHRAAAEIELGWWIVRQGALVHRDGDLYNLFETLHEEAWNTLRWLKTKVKETAPQVLAVPS
jgi:predicted RNA-binding Zn ribbon-like protein